MIFISEAFYTFGLSWLVFEIRTILWTSVFVNMSSIHLPRLLQIYLKDCDGQYPRENNSDWDYILRLRQPSHQFPHTGRLISTTKCEYQLAHLHIGADFPFQPSLHVQMHCKPPYDLGPECHLTPNPISEKCNYTLVFGKQISEKNFVYVVLFLCLCPSIHPAITMHYCLTKISIRAKRSISRVFSLFIVPIPFFVHCPCKGRINRAESVLTGLKPY